MNPLAAALVVPALEAGFAVHGIEKYQYGRGYTPVRDMDAAGKFQIIEINPNQGPWDHPMMGSTKWRNTILVCTRTGDAHIVGMIGNRTPITVRDVLETWGRTGLLSQRG